MPARPITLGNLHVCKDRRLNASGFARIFVAALGADLLMRDGLLTYSDATCSIAGATMNFERFEKAGPLPAMEVRDAFGHATSNIIERIACD
jgi:hypothetical protein